MPDEAMEALGMVVKVICVVLVFMFALEVLNRIGEDRREFLKDCSKVYTATECHMAWRTGKFQK